MKVNCEILECSLGMLFSRYLVNSYTHVKTQIKVALVCEPPDMLLMLVDSPSVLGPPCMSLSVTAQGTLNLSLSLSADGRQQPRVVSVGAAEPSPGLHTVQVQRV